MTDEQDPTNVIYLRPTAEDLSRLAAVGTPLERHFRVEDAYPISFPDLEPGGHLVFDFDYDGDEPGEILFDFRVMRNHEDMKKICTAVRLNIIGVVGWRIVSESDLPDITVEE